jgi:flagellar M-ring protein FliF
MGAFTKVTGFWEGLTGPARRLLIGAVAIFIVGVFLLMRFSGATSYATLASSTSASDAAAITKQLDDLGIRYKLTDGGATVQVPASDLDKARIELASSNVLDGGGVVGNEIFDKSNLGATDFTNRVNLVRATEGELSRTIGRLDPVATATVKIAMPQEQLFTDDQDPTTAAVVIGMKPGMTLDSGQVKGVTKLVSMAVPGLKAGDVTITDSQGNILNADAIEASGSTAAAQRIALETRYETSLQSRIDSMLAATLGPGKTVTQVNAVLDLDKVTTDSETFDKKSSTPLEAETSEETLKSGAGGTGAVAG